MWQEAGYILTISTARREKGSSTAEHILQCLQTIWECMHDNLMLLYDVYLNNIMDLI